MSIERRVPISMEPSRWYPPDFSDTFFRDPAWSNFRDPAWSNFREFFRDPIRDPIRESVREPIREIVREPVREPAVYHPASPTLPLTRSFFNPERQLNSMESEMARMAQEMKRMFSDMQHLMPVDANPESWRKKENYLLDNPVYHDQSSGRQMFRLQFDVRQFKPEEIYVKTLGNQLTVHAKHEENAEGKSLHREYLRQYVLPKDLHPEALISKLSRDGVLTIEAPLPITEGNKLIPIKHE